MSILTPNALFDKGIIPPDLIDCFEPDECGECYVCHTLLWADEVWRVLKDTGTFWLNLGDSYAGGGGAHKAGHTNPGISKSYMRGGVPHGYKDGRTNRDKWLSAGGVSGLKPKDLVGIPWMVAFALRNAGWYLRADIIWHKPNPMPESVTDRPTKSHEYIFLFSKRKKYYYDADAVRETHKTKVGPKRNLSEENYNNAFFTSRGKGERTGYHPAGRNKRSVWKIATQPYKGAHFATFPAALPEICIKAGTSEKGNCEECGKSWARVVDRSTEYDHVTTKKGKSDIGPYSKQIGNGEGTHDIRHGVYSKRKTLGWKPTCEHNAGVVPAIVLDPFGGSGTTAMVANKLGRHGISLDLSAEYLKLAKERTQVKAIEEWENGKQAEENDFDGLPMFDS